jgi:transposase
MAMPLIYPICAGLDVHKETVTVCLRFPDATGGRQQELRTYRTMTSDLLDLRHWLLAHDCRVVALESTGPYWRPIWNILEEAAFELFLVNPAHLKRAPGRKTDPEDSIWLAKRLEDGAVEGSFVPSEVMRDARELTRYRRRLLQDKTREVNRLHKILESANIKLASVATDILGVTGRALLKALIAGRQPDVAACAKGRMRRKLDDLHAAMVGRLRPHHQVLLGQILQHVDFLDAAIAQCDQEVDQLFAPFALVVALMCKTPGIGRRAAQDILAEIGPDMSQFPSAKHLCSWAAICAGNHQSGGKRLSGKTRHGNPWLRAVLVECAHAAAKVKGSYFQKLYRRLKGRKGAQRAAVAVAHSLLESLYYILRDLIEYREPQRVMTVTQRDRKIRHHLQQLVDLGLEADQVQSLLKSGVATLPVGEVAAHDERETAVA